MRNESESLLDFAAPAGSLRELLHVAFPLIISAGSLSVMNVVDRAFLAMLDVNALAASMPGAMLLWTVISLPFGIAAYSNAFIAQYEGAGRRDRVAAAVWQGLLVALLGGLCILPSAFFAETLFRWMAHDPAVQQLEVDYFVWLIPSAFPLLMCTVLSAFFAARRETMIVMYVNVLTSCLNGVLDYVLIFGIGPFPELGIQGAALGTVIAQFLSLIIFGVLLFLKARQAGYPFREQLRFDVPLFKRMLKFGFPNGVQVVLDVGAFMFFLVLVGQLGTREQAATNLAFTMNSLAFVPMLGMGTAVLTLVGRRIGEQQPELASRTVWNAMAISGVYMLLFAAIYLAFPETILAPFLHSQEEAAFAEIKPIVIDLLKFVAIYTLFDAMAIVFGSAVRGAGETRFSMIFTVSAGWSIMVLPTAWGLRQGYGLYFAWIAATVFIIVLGIGFLLRFLNGNWKTVQVIEPLVLEELPKSPDDPAPVAA